MSEEELGRSELEANKAEVTKYISNETDFPEKTIQGLLKGVNKPIDTSILLYRNSDNKPPKTNEKIYDDLVLVHLTSYKPEDDCILPRHEAMKSAKLKCDSDPDENNEKKQRSYRMTVHTSINSSVPVHGGGRWAESRFVVMTPLSRNKNRIVGYALDDTYFVGPVYLDKDSKMIEIGNAEDADCDRSAVLREMIETGVIDRNSMQAMLNSIADRNLHIEEVFDDVINEDWSVNLDNLRAKLPEDSRYRNFLEGIDSLRVSRNLDTLTQYIVVKELLAMGKLPMFAQAEQDARDFFTRYSAAAIPNWRGSGLDRFMRNRFNGRISRNNQPNVFGDYHSWPDNYHTGSVWYDLESIYELCVKGRELVTSEITKNLVGIKNEKERMLRGIELIRPGGALWVEVLKDTWRSPRAFLYARRVLREMYKDLASELEDSV